MNKILKNNQ